MRNTYNSLFFALCFSVMLVFSGCSSVPDIEENTKVDSPAEQEGNAVEGTTEENVKPPPQSPVLAREIKDQQPELDAVKYLLDQALQALENNETERAIALSDRALKVDRKSPRAYLVLAQAYYLEKRSDRARITARQGLLYTSAGSFIGRQLSKIVELK